MAKLPKWAIKKAGGINKRAWALARAKSGKKRKSSKKSNPKKTYSKGKGGNTFNFGGGLGKGIMVGAAAGLINRFIPVNIAGVDLIIAGMIMKEPIVQKIGAITLGRSLASSVGGMLGGGLGGGNGGGFGGY